MISPREWIDHLRDHAQLAREGLDPEGVHQVRVAAGRLSVWLELGERNMLRDDLSWLRRSASGMRDLDVIGEQLGTATRGAEAANGAKPEDHQLHQGAPSGLQARLRSERSGARRALLAALSSTRFSALLASLAWLPPLDDQTARKSLPHFRARVERAEARLARARGDLLAFHRLRRSVRRLRYALEWIGEDSERWKEVQEDLGQLNNLAMLQQHLEEAPERREMNGAAVEIGPMEASGTGSARSNGTTALQREVELEIDRRRTHFIDDWARRIPAIDRR